MKTKLHSTNAILVCAFVFPVLAGQHIKEFTEFLSKHTDTFQVIDECVILVGCDDLKDVPPSERLHLPQPSIDTAITQQLLDYFAQCIESKGKRMVHLECKETKSKHFFLFAIAGPILVDQLFHLVTTKFPQEHWFSMFKTPNDLTTFLKLFSNCFHIQSNLVTLLQKPVLSDMHIQQEQARAKDCINNNYTTAALTPNRTQSPIMRNSSTTVTATVGDFKLNEPVSNVKAITTNGNANANSVGNNNNKNEPNSGNDSYIPDFDAKMENLCENNCPKVSSTMSSPMSGLSSLSPNSTASSPSPSTNRSPAMSPVPPQITTPVSERSNYAGNKNQSLKQRINNLVIKTLAENSEKDKHNTAINVHQNSQTNSTTTTNANSTAASPAANNTTKGGNDQSPMFAGDTWKIKVLQNLRVISTVEDSKFVTDAIVKSAAGNDSVVISVDCEGINLGIKGELTLVEIGTMNNEAFIFDVMVCPNIMTDGGLKALLENERVIKIIHDCRNDSVNLFVQFNVLLRNVFDTQVSS